MFAEYRSVRGTEPLRQGDVLEATGPAAPMWNRHLLVITADCDLAFDKHQGRVTCVPLLAAHEYLREMQLPRIRERSVKKPLEELTNIAARGASPVRLSQQRAREWVSEEPLEDIIATLCLTGPNAEAATRAVKAIRNIDSQGIDLAESVKHLAAGIAEFQAGNFEKAHKGIVDQLRQSYRQPPGDALFLSAIADSLDVGYFAYLRHLEQVFEPEIALGPTRRNVAYRRISRLEDRFVHALVQRFAMVFLAIGLPDEYEETRDLHAQLLGEMQS